DASTTVLLLQAIDGDRVSALAHHQVGNKRLIVATTFACLLRRRRRDHVLSARALERFSLEDFAHETTRNVLEHCARLFLADGLELVAAALGARTLLLRHRDNRFPCFKLRLRDCVLTPRAQRLRLLLCSIFFAFLPTDLALG